MIDSIADILGKRKFDEPPEIVIIQKYIVDKFQANCTVTIRDQQIIIGVRSAALAGTLRMQLHELQQICRTKKRLVIRIT